MRNYNESLPFCKKKKFNHNKKMNEEDLQWQNQKSSSTLMKLESFFEELVNRGYVLGDDEIDVIVNIVFDFMVYKGIIEEEFDLED